MSPADPKREGGATPAYDDPRERRRGHVVGIVHARMGRDAFVTGDARRDEDVLRLDKTRLLDVLGFLKRDPDADMVLLVDIVAVDRGDDEHQALELHYRLRSPRLGYRLRAVVDIVDEEPSMPTLTGLFSSAEWLEREVHEMFGVWFEGHPHLRPLLLYQGFAGHPGKKSYPASKEQPLVALTEAGRAPIVVVNGPDPERPA